MERVVRKGSGGLGGRMVAEVEKEVQNCFPRIALPVGGECLVVVDSAARVHRVGKGSQVASNSVARCATPGYGVGACDNGPKRTEEAGASGAGVGVGAQDGPNGGKGAKGVQSGVQPAQVPGVR